MLKTGEAIINVKQRHHDSFLIKPPYIDQSSIITDEELKQAMKQFADELSLIVPQQEQNSSFQSSQGNDNPSPHMETLEKVVFTSIIDHPLDGVDKRTKRLGFHPTMMVKYHDSLIHKGIFKPVYVNRIKLFEITDHGRDVAQMHKIAIPKKKTRGGLEHDYWLNKTLQFLIKQKFKPVTEKLGIDIVVFDERLAIEIETGKSNIENNLLKLTNSQVLKSCFMLATNKFAEQKIKKFQSQYPTINFMNVKDFLKLSKENIRKNN